MPYRAVAAGGFAAGLLLFVSLFVEWWSPGVSGWTAFEILDLLIAATAVYAFGACAAAALGDGWPREARVLPLVGGIAFLIILVQILDPPPSVPDDTSLSTGAWMALLGAAGITAAGLTVARHLGTSERANVRREHRGF